MADGIGLPPIDGGMNKLPQPGPAETKPEGRYDPGSNADPNPPKKAKTEVELKKEREQEIIREAVKRFKMCVEADKDNRAAALEDLEFKAGKQWPADIMNARNAAKRPCLTINVLPTFTHQIANDIRQNKSSLNVSPLGDDTTREAAEVAADFIRGIERDSIADVAYDTAVTSTVDIGFGYIRVITEYESPDTFNQVIRIKRVRNPFTVHLDPSRQQVDGSDAKFGFVSELLLRDEFKLQYPKALEVSWTETGMGEAEKEWITKDSVRVAEYFTYEHKRRRLVQLDNGHVGWYDELSENVKQQITGGYRKIMNDRESLVPKIMWYKLTTAEIIESREWMGHWLPIIEVIGEEIDLQGKVIRSGVIRNAKDPMRTKNFSVTAKMETVALAPKAPWVMAEGQDEGYETDWQNANNEPIPVLHYVPVVGENGQLAQPPQRQMPPQPSAGWTDMEQGAEQDLMRTTGVRFDASISERLHDESGKAIKEIRRNTDIGAFHFSDNFSVSLRHLGRVLLDLIPPVYDSERLVAGVKEDGTEIKIKIDPGLNTAAANQQQKDASVIMKAFNPRKGRFAVAVTTGPNYATRRIEAREQMEKFINAVPEAMRGVVAALMAKYSDWPGASELYRALAKMLPPGTFMPELSNLPPAVGAMVQALESQIKQLMTERMQLLRDLTDKKEDQRLVQDKINKDYDTKLLKIITDMHKAMEEVVMQPVASMADAVKKIEASFGKFHAVGDPLMAQARNQMTAGAPGTMAVPQAPESVAAPQVMQ